MRGRWIAVVLLAGFGVAGGWMVTRRTVSAAPGGPAAERQAVELIVYSQDFGMVREVRPVQLAQGSNAVRVLEVSKQLDPRSVLLRWQGEGTGANLPRLLAHTYDLGVANGEGLLKRYLGKEVELVRYGEDGREAGRQKGRLMAEGSGEIVVQTADAFYIRPPGTIVAPTGGEIVTIPQLTVQAESASAQPAKLEVAYLTRGLSWSADYVAIMAREGSALALECWGTVTNRTGADYPGAKVSLMAGTPNRAAQLPPPPGSGPGAGGFADGHVLYERSELSPASAGKQRAMSAPSIEGGIPQTVGDLYSYRIKDPTSVAQDQMNRLLVLSSPNLPVVKDYNIRLAALSSWDDGYSWNPGGPPRRGEVAVSLTFFNREKDGLGVPLPQGAIRLYEPDRAGSLRYAGAATITNTPKDGRVDLTLAQAFDLYTESRVVKSQRMNRRTVRKQVEIVLHNEKTAPADLRLVQDFYDRWKVVSQSHPHRKLDASTAQWKIAIPAGGKVTLAYTVDLTS